MDSTDPQNLLIEQGNLYRLHELVDHIVTGAPAGSRFILTEDMIKRLHAVAMNQLLPGAGAYRQDGVEISGTPHKPPNWLEVPGDMAAMVAYVNLHWDDRDMVHLAAFVMWKVNYIHPFGNGNGRISRAASYLVLQAKHGKLLPAKNSVVEQICVSKKAYYDGLRKADVIYEKTKDVDAAIKDLEVMLSKLLIDQIKASLK